MRSTMTACWSSSISQNPVGAAACRVQSHEFTLKAAVPSVPVGGHLAFLFDDHALADETHTVRG